ncbi:MAG TPA: oligosaccharide flippase family protein [Ktedonobacteraceae bacterium]|nr:oligosaccharide flippase family protein [Ktedonobacteraceae bacterium]
MLLQHSKTLSFAKKSGVVRPGAARLCIVGCATLLGFCSTALIARSLGPTAFGSYSFIRWLATVAAPVTGIGMSALTARYTSDIASRESPRLMAGIFYFVWRHHYRKILLYCLAYLLLVLPFSRFFGGNAPGFLLLMAGLAVPPLLLNGVASITLRSLRCYDLLAAIQLVGAIVLLLLVLWAIYTQLPGSGITIATAGATTRATGDWPYLDTGQTLAAFFLLASAAANLFMLTIALLYIIRLLPLKESLAPGPLLKQRLTQGLSNSLLLFILDGIVWQPCELLLLGHGYSAAELGFYMLSSMLSTAFMNIPPVLLSSCLLPFLLRYVPGQHYLNATEAWIKTTVYTALLALPIAILMFIYSPNIITFCFGAAYLPAVTPFRILLISAALGSIATTSITRLASSGRKWAQVWPGAAAAILNLVLAFPCIAIWGVPGAALASAAAQVIYATCSIILCRRCMLEVRR